MLPVATTHLVPALHPVKIARLASDVAGPVLVPGDPGYHAEAEMWNRLVPQDPALVVGATSASDVQAAVRFAAANDQPVAVAATGHGAVVRTRGAVLITTHRMRDVSVDGPRRTARVAAGARWQEVVDAAAVHGLAPLVGSAPDVGVVGYTLGGGLSPILGRKYGYAADHVRSLEVVTADGRVRHVDAARDADLFWGLRGGKGNFGVVTAIKLELFPVTHVYGGGLMFAGAHAGVVLRAWRDLAQAAPDDLSTSVALVRMPPAAEVPAPLRGQLIVHVRVAYVGSAAAAEQLLTGLRAAAPALLDTLAEMPFTATAAIHADPTDPMPVHERTAALRALPDEAIDALVDTAGPATESAVTLVEVRRLGGALGRSPLAPNAVGNRGAAYSLFAAAVGARGDARLLAAQLDGAVASVRPWTTGGALLNFMSAADAEPEAAMRAFDVPGYARLTRLKRAVDPGNMFRVNHNIPPHPGESTDRTAPRSA